MSKTIDKTLLPMPERQDIAHLLEMLEGMSDESLLIVQTRVAELRTKLWREGARKLLEGDTLSGLDRAVLAEAVRTDDLPPAISPYQLSGPPEPPRRG